MVSPRRDWRAPPSCSEAQLRSPAGGPDILATRAADQQAATQQAIARRPAAQKVPVQRQSTSQLVDGKANIRPSAGAPSLTYGTPLSTVNRARAVAGPREPGLNRPGAGIAYVRASAMVTASAAAAAVGPSPPWFRAYMENTLTTSKSNAPRLREEYLRYTWQLQNGASMSDPAFACKMEASKAALQMTEDRIADMEALLGLPLTERTCI